jgi:hypothetical protein
MNKNAVVLITKIPNAKYLDFLNSFTNYDVYVIIDSNEYFTTSVTKIYENIQFIQINNDECRNNGFCNSSYITLKKDVTGWDKALYYFSIINQTYNNVWFIEDDVFFYGESTLLTIDEKYNEADLLCNSDYSPAKLNEWLWNRIRIELPYPYFCGMVCCARMSRALLESITDYSMKHKTLFFLEALFTTLAKHSNLQTVVQPTEFLSVKWNEKAANYNKTDLFHPNKDIEEHTTIRKQFNTISPSINIQNIYIKPKPKMKMNFV